MSFLWRAKKDRWFWTSGSNRWRIISCGRKIWPNPSRGFLCVSRFAKPAGCCRSLNLVPAVQLFSEYLYFSSFSDLMLRHARRAVDQYVRDFSLDRGSFVVEIASNDGYLLQYFKAHDVPCLGIEPASNIAKVARERGIETLVEFFGENLAHSLAVQGRPADLILGNNVFAHAPNTNDFVAGLRALLQPKGRIVLELPISDL